MPYPIPTRNLETHPTLRASVEAVTLIHQSDRSLTFETSAPLQVKKNLSSADPHMAEMQSRVAKGEKIRGTLQLDVVSSRVIRVRYAEGPSVPENHTAMLDITLESGEAPRIETSESGTRIRTAHLDWQIVHAPFQIHARDAGGRLLTEIGGQEKNHFGNWDSLNLGLLHDGDRRMAMENFSMTSGEAIYGFGEKFIKLDKSGQTIDLQTDDALGVMSPRSYKNIPFYLTTSGYGIFFHHSTCMTFWVGSRNVADIQVAVDDNFLDYFFIGGSIRDVLPSFAGLTGRPAVPPAWTFGYWQSKISYKSAEEVLDICREMRARDIPCDVVHLDTHWFKDDWYCDLEFDRERFPDPAAFLKELRDMGIRVSLWQLPYVPEGSAYFDDLMAVDGFVKNPDGSVHDSKICFTPGFVGITGVIDFTNPAAVKVFQKHIARLLRLGASVIKTDFGEQTPLNGIYHDGSTGRTMHNLYPLLYNQAAYEVTKEVTGEGAVWARSAWAGSQRYPLHWGGDNSPNFHNIIPQITGGLSLGLCGFPFWSQDIGGFCGTTDDLLLIRWMQFGMFLSHSRIHGYGDREIYKFSPEAVHHCREAIRQRYRLMPYILGSAEKCARESLPMARALVIDYQKDRNTWSLADQWLFGESLLVAPVFTADGRRDVYLPEGEWTCWWSGQVRQGGHWITTESPLEHIPIFFREGAVVPMTEPANFVGEKEIQRLEVRITRHTHPGARTSLPLTVHGRPASLEWHLDGPTHQLTYHGPRIELVPLWAGAESGLRVDQKFTDSES